MDLKKNEKGIGFANTRTTTLQHCISVKLFNNACNYIGIEGAYSIVQINVP